MIFNIIFNIFLSILIFFACINQKNSHFSEVKFTKLTGKTMGTYWQIKVPILKNKIDKIYINNLIKKNLKKDEKLLSPWYKNSLVSKFNQLKKNKLLKINKDFLKILLTAIKINKKTHGKLDITIGTLIDMWGFGTKEKPLIFPSLNTIKKNINFSGNRHLKIIDNVNGVYIKKDINNLKINLSTLGEGFSTDHISSILTKKGIKQHTISIGGTVLVKAKNNENAKIIAIQKPTDKMKSIQLLIKLKNKSISTAGNYRNYYFLNGKHISHIIDPQNGMPINNQLVSVSVISSTALEADSWDTALLVLGFKKAKILALKENLAVCLIIKNKNKFLTWLSPNFKKFLIKK
ncbi:FAD:protein FMN transferase ApbE [Buchnera aphidicola (Melanaphis sacchari)]|uniref:FAD:protein FMN transferase n=1 Tax=Buchnera aphidicola (Melanaphis sacchari) TaxID=2173854 RepID=A0A2U8DGC1_9GAMM|nr:FAD:protein FMN transferase [Buchnera aphidicola]AWH90551.1 FAD:protein FMN transferase ApbE [Buchnera aphidicola (Melanaphis sacchari)]